MDFLHIRDRKTQLYVFLLLLIGLCFYLVVSNTPLYVDDYHFLFFTNVMDLSGLPSVYGHLEFYTDRFSGVARFVPHLLVAAFSLILGKSLFNFFASAGFLFLSFLIARVVVSDRWKLPVMTIVAAVVMWFVIPGFFQACLWMSGACNYLFAISIVLVFYLLLRSDRFSSRGWTLPLWALAGFIAGWTNEGFVTGLAVGLFVHYFLLDRSGLDPRRCVMLAGFFLGVLCLCLAPYNVNRFLSGNEDVGFGARLMMWGSAVLALGNLRVMFLLLFCLSVSVIFRGRSGFGLKTFFRKNDILAISLIISLIFLILTRHDSENSRFPVEIYSLLLLISVISRWQPRFVSGLSVAGAVGLIVSTFVILPKCKANNRAYNSMQAQIEDGRQTVVVENVRLSPFERRYVAPVLFSAYHSLEMKGAADIVRYYGGDPSTVILSEDLQARLENDGDGGKAIHDPSWEMRWIRLPDDALVRDVTFCLKPIVASDLHFWERCLLPFMDRYRLSEVPARLYKIYDVDGRRWLVVLDNPVIDSRLDKIRVSYARTGLEKH